MSLQQHLMQRYPILMPEIPDTPGEAATNIGFLNRVATLSNSLLDACNT
jgi:hypothetical protein